MMPHSIRPSVDSDRTFDLEKPDPAPIRSAENAMKTHSKKTSSLYGVAVTSPPPVAEKRASVVTSAQLAPPEPQKERVPVKKIRRRSAPGTSEDYAAVQTDEMDSLIPGRRAAEADTLPANGTNEPASKWKAMSYEEQVLGRGTAHKKISSRSQRYSPVIAELRTNVIVSCSTMHMVIPNANVSSRSKTNSRSSPTSPPNSPNVSSVPSPASCSKSTTALVSRSAADSIPATS